jgi:hypothetical protein
LFPLIVGKEYFIYGVTLRAGAIWYYICDEHFVYYPVWNPAGLFEVSDSSIPESWRVGVYAARSDLPERFLLSFPEWVADEYFYDRLTDREAAEVEIFDRYRRELENSSG